MEAIWKEILTPSRSDETRYARMVIAIAHAVLGAALTTLTMELAIAATVARALIPVAYWVIKERADIAKGGSVRDSTIDTFFVWLGTFYTGPWWWPWAVLIGAFAVAALQPKRHPTRD